MQVMGPEPVWLEVFIPSGHATTNCPRCGRSPSQPSIRTLVLAGTAQGDSISLMQREDFFGMTLRYPGDPVIPERPPAHPGHYFTPMPAIKPPSTTKSEPVQNADLSEARKAASSATSSGVPMRPMGCAAPKRAKTVSAGRPGAK